MTPQLMTGSPDTLERKTGWHGSTLNSLLSTMYLPTQALGTHVIALASGQAACPVQGSLSPVH